jgi:hypothetical protein
VAVTHQSTLAVNRITAINQPIAQHKHQNNNNNKKFNNMMTTTQQHSITRNMGKKALLAALTMMATTEAFQLQPPIMVASIGSSRAASSSTKLNYAVYGGDQTTSTAGSIGIEKPKKSKTKATTITTKTVVTESDTINKDTYTHGYIVANHDNERSFWLHALQNLELSSKSPPSKQSLWTRIAYAYGPSQLREACSTIQQDALLVRVGDTDLDIALAVPTDSWDPSNLNENVVSTSTGSRKNRQMVTIRVGFPEGSSFDKDAFTFEDELTAVIQQVRLLEQNANNKLSSEL